MTDRGSWFSRRNLIHLAAGLTAGLAAGGLPSHAARAAAKPKLVTVKRGVITVATSGDMPMTSVDNGKLIGTDGEMINAIAARLGLGVETSLMAWASTIESIKTGRADIMAGNMGWTPVRARVMLCTDAIYYAGTFVVMRKEQPFSKTITVADIKGHSIGTDNGFTIVPEMKKIPGTKAVKLYDTTDACVRDIVAGRLDFAVLDAPTIDYMIEKNPSWGLKQVPIQPDAAFPQLTSKQYTVMGMNGQNTDLFDAFNAGVAWLWRTKQIDAMMAKYGVDNPDYLVPPAKDPRLAVDRDAAGHIIGPFAHKPKDFSALFA